MGIEGFETKPVPDLEQLEDDEDEEYTVNSAGWGMVVFVLILIIFVLIYANTKTAIHYGGCLANRVNDLNRFIQPDRTAPFDQFDVQNRQDVQID